MLSMSPPANGILCPPGSVGLTFCSFGTSQGWFSRKRAGLLLSVHLKLVCHLVPRGRAKALRELLTEIKGAHKK